MNQQSPTPDELRAAVKFLQSRGRTADPIPGDKAGLHKVDGRISTQADVIRLAIAAGLYSNKTVRQAI